MPTIQPRCPCGRFKCGPKGLAQKRIAAALRAKLEQEVRDMRAKKAAAPELPLLAYIETHTEN